MKRSRARSLASAARNGIVVVVAHRPSAIAGLDLILAMDQGTTDRVWA